MHSSHYTEPPHPMSEKAMRSHNENKNPETENHALLNRTQLIKLRQKALRRRTWYKTLTKIERSLIDLAIATVNKIRSTTLAKSLTLVITKLTDTTETSLQHQIQTIGIPLAQKLSQIAQTWGNKTAAKWTTNPKYARFLTICTINAPN